MKYQAVRRLLLVALVMLLILSACTVGSADPALPTPSPTEVIREELPTSTPRTTWIEVHLDPGSGDPSTLVAGSDAIFIGTVLEPGESFQREETRDFSITWTSYRVDVEETLLGDVVGEAIVAQMGGLDVDENTRQVVLVDTPESMDEITALKVGETYFFAVEAGRDARPEEQRIYFAEPVFGHVAIEDENHLQGLKDEFSREIERQSPGS